MTIDLVFITLVLEEGHDAVSGVLQEETVLSASQKESKKRPYNAFLARFVFILTLIVIVAFGILAGRFSTLDRTKFLPRGATFRLANNFLLEILDVLQFLGKFPLLLDHPGLFHAHPTGHSQLCQDRLQPFYLCRRAIEVFEFLRPDLADATGDDQRL